MGGIYFFEERSRNVNMIAGLLLSTIRGAESPNFVQRDSRGTNLTLAPRCC